MKLPANGEHNSCTKISETSPQSWTNWTSPVSSARDTICSILAAKKSPPLWLRKDWGYQGLAANHWAVYNNVYVLVLSRLGQTWVHSDHHTTSTYAFCTYTDTPFVLSMNSSFRRVDLDVEVNQWSRTVQSRIGHDVNSLVVPTGGRA